jgi:hypothetical protein
MLIIVDSRLMVSSINHDVFINIDGMTLNEYVKRKPIKRSLDDFEEFNEALFKAIQVRIKEYKQSKS